VATHGGTLAFKALIQFCNSAGDLGRSPSIAPLQTAMALALTDKTLWTFSFTDALASIVERTRRFWLFFDSSTGKEYDALRKMHNKQRKLTAVPPLPAPVPLLPPLPAPAIEIVAPPLPVPPAADTLRNTLRDQLAELTAMVGALQARTHTPEKVGL
jgi:hypothetical protein